MNRATGAAISTEEYIAQSCADILSTRVMRREYGSLLPELVDHPFNDVTRLRVYAATVMALMRWEPRRAQNLRHQPLAGAGASRDRRPPGA